MTAYYNEIDPKAAAWLRELIKRGLIADGVVDERSILDVRYEDLIGYTQCHFFAGIGGWSYALRLAGWPDDRPVWTGSPPCQPFSSAGAQKGKDDERHLAPHFAGLVAAGRPPVLFGEQVASAAVFGKVTKRVRGAADADAEPEWAWLDDLSDRLEAARYAVGASDLPAASVGAPHIRQRTFFGAVALEGLADAECVERLGRRAGEAGGEPGTVERVERLRDAVGLADADDEGPQGRGGMPECPGERAPRATGMDGGVADTDSPTGREIAGSAHGDEIADGREGRHRGEQDGDNGPTGDGEDSRTCATDSPWGTVDWLFCRDGKWRPVESGTSPLADGVSARVGRLRGYGNAIVPQAAAVFIQAFCGALDDTGPVRLNGVSEMTTDNTEVFG